MCNPVVQGGEVNVCAVIGRCGKTWSVPYYDLNAVADGLKLDAADPAEEIQFTKTTNTINPGTNQDDKDIRWRNYKQIVALITNGDNPYENIQAALNRLGITAVNKTGYQTQFGISVRPPTIYTAPHLLVADSGTATADLAAIGSDATLSAMLALLTQARATLNLTEGNFDMFIPDMPNVPAQTPVVMIAQAGQAQDITKKKERILGICRVVDGESDIVEIDPGMEATSYLWRYDKNTKASFDDAKVIIVQQPKHGILTNGQWNSVTKQFTSLPDSASQFEQNLYKYMPEQGYEGKDFAVISAEKDGVKVTIYYFLHATIAVHANYLCERPEGVWKISQDANGTPILSAVYQSPTINAGATTTDTLAATLSSSILRSLAIDPSSVTFNLANLTGGAVGQTTGDSITLDTNAAGNNWFIDTTPGLNEEYLPTSNPNEWVAKAGSDAAGKMDMLSVLLHEYGHALGIEHSADGHDYMSTTLTVGVRRLPSATELALMQQLIGQAKNSLAVAPDPFALSLSKGPSWFDKLTTNGSNDVPNPFPTLPISLGGLAFAGLLRPNRYGITSDLAGVFGQPSRMASSSISSSIDVVTTQYEAVANASFTNLNTASGWNTQGSVDIVSSTGTGQTGTATLNEVSTSQTRLNQVSNCGFSDVV